MGGKNKKHKGGGAGAGAVHAAVSAATAAARAKAAAESGAAGEAVGKRPAVRPALVSKEPRVKQGSAGERPSLPACLAATRGRPAPLACPLRALFPAPQAAALRGRVRNCSGRGLVWPLGRCLSRTFPCAKPPFSRGDGRGHPAGKGTAVQSGHAVGRV